MKAFLITGCIVLALLLIFRIRVGVTTEFSSDGLMIRVRLGIFRFTVFPFSERRTSRKSLKLKKKSKAEKQDKESDVESKSGGTLALVQSFLPLVAESAGQLKRKIRVDLISLELVMAAPEPAAAAFAYGAANTIIGMLWPLLEHNFNVIDRRIRTGVDFQAVSPTIHILATLSLTIGQGVMLVVRLIRVFFHCSTIYRAKNRSDLKRDTVTTRRAG